MDLRSQDQAEFARTEDHLVWKGLRFVGVATVSATVDEFRPWLVGGLRAQYPRSPYPGVSRR